MQFEYTNPQTELERMFGGYFCINCVGRIETDDHLRFKEFLSSTAPPPRTSIYINSTGGDVEAAIEIGRIIRANWFSTPIGTYVIDHTKDREAILSRKHMLGSCMSAATLMFIGGKLRYFSEGSKFGVHQFSFKNPRPDNVSGSQVLSAKIAGYVVDMGISADFLEISSSVLNTEIKLVDENQLRALRVITGGVTDAEWSVQAIGTAIYVKGERDSLFGHHKVMLGYAKSEGFFFFAVVEAQGRDVEMTTFGLVEIVLDDEELRIDVSGRCSREIVNGYLNVVVSINDEEAKLIAFSKGFGVQIRMTDESPVFLGISPVSTSGGSEQLKAFYTVLSGKL